MKRIALLLVVATVWGFADAIEEGHASLPIQARRQVQWSNGGQQQNSWWDQVWINNNLLQRRISFYNPLALQSLGPDVSSRGGASKQETPNDEDAEKKEVAVSTTAGEEVPKDDDKAVASQSKAVGVSVVEKEEDEPREKGDSWMFRRRRRKEQPKEKKKKPQQPHKKKHGLWEAFSFKNSKAAAPESKEANETAAPMQEEGVVASEGDNGSEEQSAPAVSDDEVAETAQLNSTNASPVVPVTEATEEENDEVVNLDSVELENVVGETTTADVEETIGDNTTTTTDSDPTTDSLDETVELETADSSAVTTVDQTDEEEEEEDQDSAWNALMSNSEILNGTQQLRAQGKELYNLGNYGKASKCFASAAEGLSLVAAREEQDDADGEDYLQDAGACRLHQALCLIKSEDYDGAVDVCNLVLAQHQSSSALRARALYRRAKARLALDEVDAARNDARSAAFLGDRKAVDLYGQLLREESASSSSNTAAATSLSALASTTPSATPDLSESSASLLSALLKNPTASSGAFGQESSTSASNQGAAASSPATPFPFGGGLPSNLFGDSSSGNKAAGPPNLLKTLSSKQTQGMICAALQSTNKVQLQQFASMAGITLQDSHAERLEQFCHGVKPKTLQACVTNSQRVWYVVQLFRKIGALLARYRILLVCFFLLGWIKSLFV